MRRIYSIIAIFLFSGILIGQNISNIKLVYGLEGTHLPISAQCNPESFSFSFGDDINFLTTYDILFIERFYELLKSLKLKDDESAIDPRIMCVINYTNKSLNDTLYLGELHGLVINGNSMQDNIELLNLIKDKIGWRSQVVGHTELDLKIKKMQQLYSSELLLKAIEHVTANCFQDSCFGDFFFRNVNNLLYKIQNSKDGLTLINKISIWCETYVLINTYTNHVRDILLEMPQIGADLSDWLKHDSSKTNITPEIQYKITNYLSSCSNYERISFIECLIRKSKTSPSNLFER